MNSDFWLFESHSHTQGMYAFLVLGNNQKPCYAAIINCQNTFVDVHFDQKRKERELYGWNYWVVVALNWLVMVNFHQRGAFTVCPIFIYLDEWVRKNFIDEWKERQCPLSKLYLFVYLSLGPQSNLTGSLTCLTLQAVIIKPLFIVFVP